MTGGYLQLLDLAGAESVLVLTALAVLAVDLFILREEALPHRWWIEGGLACLGCLAGGLWLLFGEGSQAWAGGMMVTDPLVRAVKGLLLLLSAGTVLTSLGTRFTLHVGEYLALLLLGTVGMLLLAATENLLMLFVSLELMSLSLYLLTAFNRREPKSGEAALKYFLFGSVAAAFTLYGLSLLYGYAGGSSFASIAAAWAKRGWDPLFAMGMVMTLVGFGFKVAAVPFHLWAPDVYEGAPTPAAALVATGSKVASVFVFAKLLWLGLAHAQGSGAWHHWVAGWTPVLAGMSLFSMIVGNLAAMVQRNVKRLLAYSAIAHGGYALLALMAAPDVGMPALVFYLAAYAMAVLGAFATVNAVEQGGGGGELPDFAGLAQRSPFLAFCLLVFLLSLAGIPPLSGFLGKFYVFAAAAGGTPPLGMLWLVVAAIATSAISLYYYLQVLKQAYVVSAPASVASPLKPGVIPMFTVGLFALLVILLGLLPQPFIGLINQAMGK